MFKFDADLTSVDTGVWQEFQGSKFLIAHISNSKFQRALARYQQPHRRKIEEGRLDPEINKDMLCRAMAEGILLDWADVTSKSGSKDGVKIEYTTANAYKSLKGNLEFRDFVSDFAISLANFRDAEVEELGNS